MANLIITIISIALVAVAALMGAYYGGAAFLQGQEKARANAMINGAQQIAAAIDLWRLNNGNATEINASGPSAFNFLVSQGYLTQVPQDPEGTGQPTNFYYYCDSPSVVNNFSNWASNSCEDTSITFSPRRYVVINLYDTIGSSSSPPTICKEITKIARGSSATPGTNGVLATGLKFDCVWSSNYVAWYLVYALF